jgi:hypothetical protein
MLKLFNNYYLHHNSVKLTSFDQSTSSLIDPFCFALMLLPLATPATTARKALRLLLRRRLILHVVNWLIQYKAVGFSFDQWRVPGKGTMLIAWKSKKKYLTGKKFSNVQ